MKHQNDNQEIIVEFFVDDCRYTSGTNNRIIWDKYNMVVRDKEKQSWQDVFLHSYVMK